MTTPIGELKPSRILIVEDSADAVDALAHLLRVTGAEVVTTGSAGAALKAIATQDFDVVVADLGLPDVPGDVVVRHIVSTVARRPRIVVMTGRDETWHRRALDAGADVVLVKPFNWSELVAAVHGPDAPELAVTTPDAA